MLVPERLDQWSIETIKELLAKEHYERPEFEFKQALVTRIPGKGGEEYRDRVRHAALAFANSLSGHLIFGVMDRENEPNPAKRLVGIEDGGHREMFGELVKEADPSIAFDVAPKLLLPVTTDPTRGVLVVHVPHSPLRPHCLRGVFYKRMHAGSVATMSRQEVLEAMLGTTDRLNKIALLRLELTGIRRVASALTSISIANVLSDLTFTTKRYEVDSLKSLLTDLGTLLPVGERAVEIILDLEVAAREQNRSLDRLLQLEGGQMPGVSGGMRTLWATGIQQEARRIQELCGEIESTLLARFGPSRATT